MNETFKGMTTAGFKWEIPASRLDSMELVDALSEIEGGNVLAISKVVTILLGPKQKKRLYDFLRDSDGVVSATKVSDTIAEILQSSNDTKNY